MGATEKRGYWFPNNDDDVSNFPGQTELLFMNKLDTDMDTALTGSVAASRVSGALAAANIPNLAASKITSGTLAPARLPLATTSAPGAMSTTDKTKLDGLAEGVGNLTAIPSGADLNDYTTTGLYHQSSSSAAAAGSNYPRGYAGLLEVFSTGSFAYQRYMCYGTYLNDYYYRTLYNSTWQAWRFIGTGSGGSGGPITADQITDATDTGRNVLTAASAAAARSAIGAGTSSQTLSTGTAAELTTGTATTARAWTAKILADYVKANGGGSSPAWVDGTIPDTAKMNANTKAKIRANGDGTATVIVSGGLGTAFSSPNESEEVFTAAVEFPYSAAYAPAFDAKSFVPATGFDELFNSVTVQLVAAVQKTGTTSVRINLTRPPTQGSMQGQLVGFSITYLI